jgi:hypothetical protein
VREIEIGAPQLAGSQAHWRHNRTASRVNADCVARYYCQPCAERERFPRAQAGTLYAVRRRSRRCQEVHTLVCAPPVAAGWLDPPDCRTNPLSQSQNSGRRRCAPTLLVPRIGCSTARTCMTGIGSRAELSRACRITRISLHAKRIRPLSSCLQHEGRHTAVLRRAQPGLLPAPPCQPHAPGMQHQRQGQQRRQPRPALWAQQQPGQQQARRRAAPAAAAVCGSRSGCHQAHQRRSAPPLGCHHQPPQQQRDRLHLQQDGGQPAHTARAPDRHHQAGDL